MGNSAKKIPFNRKFISATKRRVMLWLVALFFFYLFSYLVDPFHPMWKSYFHEPFGRALEDFLWTFGFSIVISELCIFINSELDKPLPWISALRKRLIVQTILQVLGSVLLMLFVNIFVMVVYEDFPGTNYYSQLTWLAQCMAATIAVSLLLSVINTGELLLNKWKQSTIQAAQQQVKVSELKQSAMAAELQALKLQIDPHFIFNNLSVLSEVILEDQQSGYEYAESLARVYRYLLVNSKKDLIGLEEELKFLDAYIFMIKKRLGDGVHFDLQIKEDWKSKLIPPMTLQFLVENAIKHNQTSKSMPLEIRISCLPTGELLVSNTLKPLLNKIESSGVGMLNIKYRFELLGAPKPTIECSLTEFKVKLPLL
ncbi:sensor histidine kinase [Sphingobacterium sp. Mn56C]|uniref:sensor histidine kinase n=1 Tax=Sphingobacterium sp. Mn56C TaxID=3395261 RepID=UPI003BE7151F